MASTIQESSHGLLAVMLSEELVNAFPYRRFLRVENERSVFPAITEGSLAAEGLSEFARTGTDAATQDAISSRLIAPSQRSLYRRAGRAGLTCSRKMSANSKSSRVLRARRASLER